MSSNTYSTCLLPDPRIRSLLLAVGIALGVAGTLLIARMPLDPAWRLFGSATWVYFGYREVYSLSRGFRRCDAIRLSKNAGFTVLVDGDDWMPATLLPGSVVTRRVAWLRLEVAGQARYAELFVGNSRECNNWRRLQVLWRHIGAVPLSC